MIIFTIAWNKFVIKPTLNAYIVEYVKHISKLNRFNDRFLGWMVTHKTAFIRIIQAFYWLAFLLICLRLSGFYKT